MGVFPAAAPTGEMHAGVIDAVRVRSIVEDWNARNGVDAIAAPDVIAVAGIFLARGQDNTPSGASP